NYYGNLHAGESPWRLPWNPTFLYLYCGIPALIFIAAALLRRPDRRVARFGAITVFSLFWMLGGATPVGRTSLQHLPGFMKSSMYPEFGMVAFTLCMAALAAMGAHRLLDGKSWATQMIVLAVVAAD